MHALLLVNLAQQIQLAQLTNEADINAYHYKSSIFNFQKHLPRPLFHSKQQQKLALSDTCDESPHPFPRNALNLKYSVHPKKGVKNQTYRIFFLFFFSYLFIYFETTFGVSCARYILDTLVCVAFFFFFVVVIKFYSYHPVLKEKKIVVFYILLFMLCSKFTAFADHFIIAEMSQNFALFYCCSLDQKWRRE